MADSLTPPSGNALARAAAANDIVVIADPDHTDRNIPAAVERQLDAMKAAGVQHLYLEHDPHDVTREQLRSDPTSYGAMIRKAETLGIAIHEYDDRSEARAVEARYPEAARFMREHDTYGADPAALVAAAPNPQQMQEFIDAKRQQLGDLTSRNTRIEDSIAADMQLHPGQKAVVLIGEAHTQQTNDVDEGLRQRGFRTITVEVNSAQSNLDPANAIARDKPDIIVAAETGNAVAFKDPQTQRMQRAMAGIALPWKNTEAIVSHPADEPPAHGTPAAPVMPRSQNQR